ncbi:MAG: FAD-dependent oxidoreductase [Desulfobacteraceae bacterium]|nr:FAD-dependent oxidoreductase [Desulfobacteraceae bacterium]
MSRYDVIIIGAGPAGLSAGAVLGEMGLNVLVLDEQSVVGGQIYRRIETAPEHRLKFFGRDYSRGLALADRFKKSGAKFEGSATVWQAESDGSVCYSRRGKSKMVWANYILVATGAMERPVPLPGWTLSGVMGAGAANALAKEAGLVPAGRVVLAGSGPLLLLEASLLLKKGVDLLAVLETTPVMPPVAALPKGVQAILDPGLLFKGLKILREIKKSKIQHYKGVKDIRVIGTDGLESVEAMHKENHLNFTADILLVHFGVIPNTHMVRQMGCAMEWDHIGRFWQPKCDEWGRTIFERVFTAGDGAGVSGAGAAAFKGELAALEIARCLGILNSSDRDRFAASVKKAIKQDGFARPFIDHLFAPRFDDSWFEDETMICRCENITVGEIRRVVAQGVKDVNEVKVITRCGMGPCQGRMCGPALAEVVGQALSICPEDAGLLRIRPPVKPVPLEEIASMDMGSDGGMDANWLLDKK